MVFLVVFIFAVCILSMIAWLIECIDLVVNRKLPRPLAWTCLIVYVATLVVVLIKVFGS